ncbi:MAG: hypothetical protein V3U53_04695, partial [bacterium]
AADFTAAGITASPEILEAQNGYCESFSGKGNFRLDEVVDRLGNPYVLESPGNNLKPYPCCMSAHASIDALRDLIDEENLTADQVERIDVDLMKPNMMNLSYNRPKTGLEGKFSAEYTLSRILMDGTLRLDTFTDEAVNEPAAQAMIEKVHVHLAEEPGWEEGTARPATVTVRKKDGETLQKRGERSRGTALWPLSEEEVHEKFRDCAERKLGPEKAGEALSILTSLEEQSSVHPLMSLLA